ncbi:hypothetical protein AYR56_07460 [Loigolactobacillus backii]|uniref:Type I restriction modification DNA specificity domain-containing protein n=1 Tax=Loigolactobacillus backii TaxID=375175 RepID=A0A192H437_9LACO|nr:restriction endonuclease subunit S [Loigolactobacillus backii]ANK62982.1 hypothetical protein AYR53_09545 [Loigolactobacillus backii]ANK70010.1 hypothetical protein AYR56_07460 [Loigolactobacillus backii]
MTEVKRRVPLIRFKGFSDDWNERVLNDIATCFSGGTPSAKSKKYYGGNIPFIRSGEINKSSTELFITEDGLDNSSAKMVKRGDILFALYGATSGEVGISKINGAINQAVLAINPIQKDDPYLITQWLKRQKKIITGTYLQGGQGNLSASIVKKLIISLSRNLSEQKKVSDFFKTIDNLIAANQRKLELLNQLKKGFIRRIINQELRFKEFPDAWKDHTLGSFIIEYSGKTKINNQYPILTSSRKGLFLQMDYYGGHQIASKNNIGYNIVPRGYFTYRHMSDDEVFKFNINELVDYGIVSTLYPVFKTTSALNPYFLQYLLNYGDTFKRYALIQKQGGS